jgi:hypothetical protein
MKSPAPSYGLGLDARPLRERIASVCLCGRSLDDAEHPACAPPKQRRRREVQPTAEA